MKILLSTHGHMASGMKSAIEILVGNTDKVLTTFDSYVNDDKLEDAINDFFCKSDTNEIKILLSDLYGGSVCQIMVKYLNMPNTFVVTGVTLGLLLSLVIKDNISKEELCNLINQSKELSCLIESENVDDSKDDFFG